MAPLRSRNQAVSGDAFALVLRDSPDDCGAWPRSRFTTIDEEGALWSPQSDAKMRAAGSASRVSL
jgi:hypothetical protein